MAVMPFGSRAKHTSLIISRRISRGRSKKVRGPFRSEAMFHSCPLFLRYWETLDCAWSRAVALFDGEVSVVLCSGNIEAWGSVSTIDWTLSISLSRRSGVDEGGWWRRRTSSSSMLTSNDGEHYSALNLEPSNKC
jgi:hypothetical protein